VGKPVRKRTFVKSRRRVEGNIKPGRREIGCEDRFRMVYCGILWCISGVEPSGFATVALFIKFIAYMASLNNCESLNWQVLPWNRVLEKLKFFSFYGT
jgi:hypothetical protein